MGDGGERKGEAAAQEQCSDTDAQALVSSNHAAVSYGSSLGGFGVSGRSGRVIISHGSVRGGRRSGKTQVSDSRWCEGRPAAR